MPFLMARSMVSFGMFCGARLVDRRAQARVAVDVAAAQPRRDRDLLDDLGPELRLLGVGGLFLVLDLGPPVMAGHGRYFLSQSARSPGASRRAGAGRRRQRRAVPGVRASHARLDEPVDAAAGPAARRRRRPSRRSSTPPRRRCMQPHDLAAVAEPVRARCARRPAGAASRRAARGSLALRRVVARRHDQRVARRAPASRRAGGSPPLASSRRSPAERHGSAPEVAQLDELLRRLRARRRWRAPR